LRIHDLFKWNAQNELINYSTNMCWTGQVTTVLGLVRAFCEWVLMLVRTWDKDMII
jgi:hypothetical protein